MGRLCLVASPPEVPGYRVVCSQTSDYGRGGFNDEYAHTDGNTRYLIRMSTRGFVVSLLKMVK